MQISARSQLLSARRNPQKAGQILEGLFPDTDTRAVVIKILVDAIQTAARIAPKSWGVSLFPAKFCLNVGRGAVLQLCPNKIVFMVTGSRLEGLTRRARSSFRDNQAYRFIPDAIEGSLADARLDCYAAFRPAHMDLIERAAQNRKVCFWPGAHAPGVVDYLRSVGHGVPSPGLPLSSETGSWQSRLTDKVRVPTAEETVEQNLFDRRMIFLRIGWMHSYEGIAGGDAIIGGGAFVTEHGYGHEIFNFRSFQGAVYGFVQPPGRRERWEDGKINIARLGVQTDDDRVSGVLVVWVATSPDGGTFIIGWYKNATIYRERQPAPPGSARRHLDDDCGYYVTASAEDARLLPPDERVFSIPQLGRGGPGQSNIWCADDPDQHRQLRLHVLRYIESEQLPTMQHDEVPGRRQPDPLFRQRVEEIAVDKTKDYFTRLGYRVKSVEEDNVGWDLTAVLGERELKLEVKGLSGSQVVVELINHLIIICTSTGIGG